ncbi:MAG TPA: hypothetical protein VJR90_08635 [Gammaproteobacteria bacterium]|nr:hypothetical protein [Gammaproteobacteria bacterium]
MRLAVLILVVLVVLAGLTLATFGWRRRHVPLAISSLHGLAGIAVIVLLVVLDTHYPHNRALIAATVLFVLAATGGLMLFALRAARQSLPSAMVVLHGGFAVVALIVMLIGFAHTG